MTKPHTVLIPPASPPAPPVDMPPPTAAVPRFPIGLRPPVALPPSAPDEPPAAPSIPEDLSDPRLTSAQDGRAAKPGSIPSAATKANGFKFIVIVIGPPRDEWPATEIR